MEAVERNLGLVLQNQITQAELLNQLLSTHSESSSLPVDDNKKGEKEKVSQQLKDQQIKDQQIKDQHIKKAYQQITQEDQQLKSGKRKSSSTSDQPLQKKAKQGLEAIKERRKLGESQKKDLDEQGKKQVAEVQRKTKEIISAIEKGTTIQTGSDVDNSTQISKEYGSPSGTKSLRISYAAFPTPPKPKGKSISRRHIP